MAQIKVIDADGHVLERQADIRKYLDSPWDRRSTPLWPGDQAWDANLFDSFKKSVSWQNLSPKEQIQRWHDIMDKEAMETAICFPTGSGNVPKIQEVPYQIAVAKACNRHFAKEYNALSDRVSCVGTLPMRSRHA